MKNIFKKFARRLSSDEDFIQTFTKKWVGRLMWFAILSTTFTYALAGIAIWKELNPDIIASLVDLSKYGIYMIIGVMFSYMIKSFFGKYSEEKNKLVKLSSPKSWEDASETVEYEENENIDEEEV